MAAPLALGLLASGAGTKVAGLGLLKGVGQAALAAAPFVPSLMQGFGGDPVSGAASAGATALAGKYGIRGKHKAATQAITGVLAPMLMPSVLGGVGQAAQAAGGLISGGQDRQMLRGESPTALGIGEGKGIESLTIDQFRELARINPEVARELNPMMNQNLDRQMQRQMQLNQQLGQLTGALNQQKYMANLAAGAQAEAGATTRNMINSVNPYAASVFRYQG